MPEPHLQLHLVTDGTKDSAELCRIASAAASAGVDYIQLRYKSFTALQLFQLGKQLSDLLAGSRTRLLINDRIEVALAVGAYGVHLGGQSLPVSDARKLLGPDAWIGRSVHSLAEAVAAEQEGASYLTYGHIFESHSKPGLPPRGLSALKQVAESVSIPVIAIGGIHEQNVQAVMQQNAAGIAVIGAIMASPDPAAAARRLRQLLG